MSRPGDAPAPVGAPVPAQPWVGFDLGREEKPRIRLERLSFSLPAMVWVCSGADCRGVGLSPHGAYAEWREEVGRVRGRANGWQDALARFPVVHPTAARLLADLEAAIAARPAGWWRRMLPGAGGWRP